MFSSCSLTAPGNTALRLKLQAPRTAKVPLSERIRAKLPELSAQFQAIGRFCLDNLAHLHRLRIEDASAMCGARPSTIVRFAKCFGLTGYKQLKVAFLDELSPPAGVPTVDDGPLLSGLDDAVQMLSAANKVAVITDPHGAPLTAFLEYALKCFGKKVQVFSPDDLARDAIQRVEFFDVLMLAVVDQRLSQQCLSHLSAVDVGVVAICPEPGWIWGERASDRLDGFRNAESLKTLTGSLGVAQDLVRGLASQSSFQH